MRNFVFTLLICVLGISNITVAEGGKKIVKWVDKNGVTQYGDKLPASEAGRNSSEMNTQGMTVKKNVAVDKSSNVADQEKLAQERKDSILLASYTKAEEIDLARDRNLQMDKSNIQALSQQRLNVSNRNARNIKSADDFKAKNKPVPAYLNDELKLANSEIAKLDKQLAERKLSMEATNKRYAEEKARFIALTNTGQQATTQSTMTETTPKANSGAASTVVDTRKTVVNKTTSANKK